MRPEKQEFMPVAALKAAIALGDSDAMEELKKMRTNAAVTLSIIAFLAACVCGISVSMDGCAQRDHAAAERDMVEVKAKADLELRRQSDAAALRLKYVQACRVSPEEAEQLIGPH